MSGVNIDDRVNIDDLSAVSAFSGTVANYKLLTLDLNEAAAADQTKVSPLTLFDARYTLAGVDNSTPVTLAGTPDYLALSGQQITLAQIDLTTDVTGALPIANGGSGQTTQQAAIDALTAVSGATDEHVLTKDAATGNAIFKAAAGGSSLPVVDETAIVYKTGTPANTLTLNVDAFTTARTVTIPDASFTVAGLSVANTFTAAQKITGTANVNQFEVTAHSVQTNIMFAITSYGGAAGDLLRFYPHVPTDNFGSLFLLKTTNTVTGKTSLVDVKNNGTKFQVMNNGQTSMGRGLTVTAPEAQLYVDQNSTTGAIPVLLLDQADVDQVIAKFIGTSDGGAVDRTLVDAGDYTTPGSIAGWIQVEIEDTRVGGLTDGDYYIPFYSAPSA